MHNKLLKSLIEELAGKESEPIVDILLDKKDVNEFLIEKKMNITVNQVRNILYKLSIEGLVSFIRKKDKRKGWYIYYWTLNTERCLIKLKQTLAKKIGNLEQLLNSRETKRFYICKPCNIEVSEEKALEHDFTCEECAGVYELVDNEPMIKEIKAKIQKAERELKIIEQELTKTREKEEKRKARQEKKEEKEKQRKKKLAKRKSKKTAEKLKPKKKKKIKPKSLKKKKKTKSFKKKVSKKKNLKKSRKKKKK